MGKIIVFGGTFNPLHKGHVEIISVLSKLNGVDKILLMPDKIPPHKTCDVLASDDLRFKMCEIIANRFNNVNVSRLELDRQGKSYTIDTINQLSQIYPNSKLAITIGGDMLVRFDKWKDYEGILSKSQIICFGRGGTDKKLFCDKVEFLKNKGGDILVLDNKITQISSRYLRENINNTKIIKKYIDKDVLSFILENKVYGD